VILSENYSANVIGAFRDMGKERTVLYSNIFPTSTVSRNEEYEILGMY